MHAVQRQSQRRNHHHDGLVHRLRRAQPQHRLVKDPDRESHQRQRVDERREHAGPVVAVRLDLVRRLGLQVEARPRKAQRQCVREIVARIGKQRQGMRLQAGKQFDQHERGSRHQRPPENTSGSVGVPVTVSVGMHPLLSVYSAPCHSCTGPGLSTFLQRRTTGTFRFALSHAQGVVRKIA